MATEELNELARKHGLRIDEEEDAIFVIDTNTDLPINNPLTNKPEFQTLIEVKRYLDSRE